MGSGIAATTAIESLAIPTGVNMEKLKLKGLFLNKVRDRLVISGTNPTASPMAGIKGPIDVLKSYASPINSTMKATPMEEMMLALEKAIKKSLDGPVRKIAPQLTQGM